MHESAYDRWITYTLPEAYFASLEEQQENEPARIRPAHLWGDDCDD